MSIITVGIDLAKTRGPRFRDTGKVLVNVRVDVAIGGFNVRPRP
jgi:hypothetical protein